MDSDHFKALLLAFSVTHDAGDLHFIILINTRDEKLLLLC